MNLDRRIQFQHTKVKQDVSAEAGITTKTLNLYAF